VASLSSELETLQKLLRDAGRDEQEPIYFSLDDGAEPEAALDQLIKAVAVTTRLQIARFYRQKAPAGGRGLLFVPWLAAVWEEEPRPTLAQLYPRQIMHVRYV
jgi:hypothetical protein